MAKAPRKQQLVSSACVACEPVYHSHSIHCEFSLIDEQTETNPRWIILWERTNNQRRKHMTIIVTGLSRDFLGRFVYVFFSPKRNDPPKINQSIFATHPVPGQLPNFFRLCAFLSLQTSVPIHCE